MKVPLTIKRDTLEWLFKQFSDHPFSTVVFGSDETEHSILITCDDRIPGLWGLSRRGEPVEEHADLAFTLVEGVFPPDISSSISASYQEAVVCFHAGCLSATLGLCGKILETALWEAYRQVAGETPDVKGHGLNAILNRLNSAGFQLKKEPITQQMELIGIHRNKAIHGGVTLPSYDQAKGILHLTRDVLSQLQSRKAL